MSLVFSQYKLLPKSRVYTRKTRSLDNAIREFSLAKPSWYMSHYTMIYKNGEHMHDFLGLFVFIVSSLVFYILGGVLIKQLFRSRLLDMR